MPRTNRKTFIAVLSALVLIVLLFLLFLLPDLYENSCRSRFFPDMDAQLSLVENSSICIIHATEERAGSVTYSPGAGGVIIHKEHNQYFAITAYHVVKNLDAKHLIMTALTPSMEEFRRGGNVSALAYYGQLPEAEVVYVHEEYDLAIISFRSSEELSIANRSVCNPVKGDRIAAIGVQYVGGERLFSKNYGYVRSTKPKLFDPNDNQEPTMVLKMNAYSAPGSSGSPVYNEKAELVGMVIGGRTDFLGRFRSGVFIPIEMINTSIQTWQMNEVKENEAKQTGFYGNKLVVIIDGKAVVYERYRPGIGSLTPKRILDEFQETTQMESIVWEVFSTAEFPDLSYILVISGTNASWTYHITNNYY